MTSVLPGAVVIARIRRLIYVAVVAGVVYSLLSTGSRGGCAGGVTGDGGFLDSYGNPSDIAPTCVSLALGPSPLILIVLVATVLVSLGRVLRRAEDEASALRILDRAALTIIVVAAVSGVVVLIAFSLMPLDGFDGSGTLIWPYPFGIVHLQTSPLTTS